MPRDLTTEEVTWLVENCLAKEAVSPAPDWPPGQFFKRVLGGGCMRETGQLETAYLMLQPS